MPEGKNPVFSMRAALQSGSPSGTISEAPPRAQWPSGGASVRPSMVNSPSASASSSRLGAL